MIVTRSLVYAWFDLIGLFWMMYISFDDVDYYIGLFWRLIWFNWVSFEWCRSLLIYIGLFWPSDPCSSSQKTPWYWKLRGNLMIVRRSLAQVSFDLDRSLLICVGFFWCTSVSCEAAQQCDSQCLCGFFCGSLLSVSSDFYWSLATR